MDINHRDAWVLYLLGSRLMATRNSLELWMIRNNLVASQRSRVPLYREATWYETLHYYCPHCGEVWGLRADSSATKTFHRFEKVACKECGGNELMTKEFELDDPETWYDASVLAHIILTLTEEGHKNETCKDGN